MSTASRHAAPRGADGELAALRRCDAEIREILERPDVVAGDTPAWLVHLGVSDWEWEREFLEKAEGD